MWYTLIMTVTINRLCKIGLLSFALIGAPKPVSKPTTATQPAKPTTATQPAEPTPAPKLTLDYLLGATEHPAAKALRALLTEVYASPAQHKPLIALLEQLAKNAEKYLQQLNNLPTKGEGVGHLLLRDVRNNIDTLLTGFTHGFKAENLLSCRFEVLNAIDDKDALSAMTFGAHAGVAIIALHTLAAVLPESKAQNLLQSIKIQVSQDQELTETQKEQIFNTLNALSRLNHTLATTPGVGNWQEVCSILAHGTSFEHVEHLIKYASTTLLNTPGFKENEKLLVRESIALVQGLFEMYRKHYIAHNTPKSKL
jgi:hypothetical protein